MKVAKLGVLFLVSMMALAGIGTAYADWTQDLHIDGTINTGWVEVEWSDEGTRIVGDDKGISCITTLYDGDTLSVSICSAFPCVDYYIDFNIHCVGSIPVHLGHLVITSNDLPPSCTLEIVTDPYCTQLHQGDCFHGSIHIHLTNDVPNIQGGSIYTFTAQVTAYQYNIYP